jgi:hypothetical protein
MAKQSYMKRTDEGKKSWLTNFSNKLGGYATKYNLTPMEVADMVASSAVFAYWFNYLAQYKEYMLKLTAFKNELRDGVPAGGSPSVEPTPPAMGLAPAPVAPGIFNRATSIGNRIKESTGYTVADGSDLGLEGAEIVVDTNIKPAIKAVLVAGGHPKLQWKKGAGTDGIHFFVKRGSSGSPTTPGTPTMPGGGTTPAGFIFLASDTEPHYTDTAALPALGQSEVWTYKAVYFSNGAEFGQFSDEVKVTVTGVV